MKTKSIIARIMLRLLYNCDGYKTARLRVRLYRELGMKTGKNVIIKKGTIIEYPERMKFGSNISIQQNCFLSGYGKITIGNNVSIAHGVSIVSSSHDYENSEIIRNAKLLVGEVIIDDNVWIGMKSSLLYNIKIGKNSVVGANSLVTKSFNDNLIIGGIPAKILKKRMIL